MSSSRKSPRPVIASVRPFWDSAWLIWPVIALGCMLRLLFYAQAQESPFFLAHFSDSRIYAELAQRLLSEEGLTRAWFMAPLYPWILATLSWMGAVPEYGVRLLQIAVACSSMWVLWKLGTAFFGTRVGLLAALLMAVSPQLVYYDNAFLVESISTSLIVFMLYVLHRALETRRNVHWIVSGLLMGVAILARPNMVVFVPLFVIACLFRKDERQRVLRGPVPWMVAGFLVLTPAFVHNYGVERVFLPVTSSFGFNLYAGNNEAATGLYTPPPGVDLYIDPNGHRHVEGQTGQAMNDAEVSSWWRNRALLWVAANPGDFVLLYARKLLLFFHPDEIDQLGISMAFHEQQYGAVPALPRASLVLILILGGAGIVLAMRKGKGDWFLLLFLFSYVAVTSLFFVNGRLRVPVLPLLYLYAAYAAVAAVQFVRLKDTGGLLPLGGGALLGVLILLLQPAMDVRFEQEYLRLGQLAFEQRDVAEAETYFRRSLEERETVDGRINLANTLAATQRYDASVVEYRRALAMDSTSALAWYNYGNMWMQRGDAPRAHASWIRAVKLNPDLAAAHRNLGILLFQAGRLEESEQHYEIYIRLETDAERRRQAEEDLRRLRTLRSAPSR